MKNKIIYIIMIIAIIFGAVIVKFKDFNYGILYSNHKRLEIIIGREFELNDAKKIVKENLNSDVKVRKATLFGTTLSIDSKEFNDEEIKVLFEKLNEKYSKNYKYSDLKKEQIFKELNITSIENLTDDEINGYISQIKEKYGIEYTLEDFKEDTTNVRISDVYQTSFWDIIKGYLPSLGLSLIIIMIFYGIRYLKLYKKAWIIEPLKLAFELILNQLFLVSIIAIARIPISIYIPCALLLIWLLQLLSTTFNNEAKLKEIKELE